MEFLTKLKEKKRIEYKSLGSDYAIRMFEWIRFNGDIALSIQCSWGHYCFPRKTLDVSEYEAMELCVLRFNESTSVDTILRDSNIVKMFHRYFEGTVYPHVPVALLEQLYQELKVTYGLFQGGETNEIYRYRT